MILAFAANTGKGSVFPLSLVKEIRVGFIRVDPTLIENLTEQ